MFRTKKRFGQHFLVNQNVLQKICDYCNLSPNKRCIEIGPGLGALTRFLLKTEAILHVVEIDERLKPKLDKLQEANTNFSYTIADVLSVDLMGTIGDKATVAGNLPYEICDPWVAFCGDKSWGYKEDQADSTHPIACVVSDVAGAGSIFDGISYSKGSAVMRQLYELMGRPNFSKAMGIYFNKYQFNNTVLEDL